MCDLRTDSVPLGSTPAATEPSDYAEQGPPQPSPNQAKTGPRVIHITGSQGVHIGPVFHNVDLKPKPKMDTKNMPLQKDVDALRRCHREIGERDKFIVSEHLGAAWKSLGRAMDFSSGQLENVEADYSRSADRANEILSLWHDKESERATVSRLTQLIIEVKSYHVLKYLKP